MDANRFDELARSLAASRSRRGVVKGLVGGAAVLVGVARGRGPAAAAPNSCAVGCAGLPGPQKAACKQACRECGGDINRVCIGFGPVGPSSFACCPEGTGCSFETGECVEVATCPSGEPAENCTVGIETNCGVDGACGLVTAVGGGDCQCVERFCTDVPCTSDADCAEVGGACVAIPGCCPDEAFCAIPCGGGEGISGTRTAGWSR